MDHLLFCGPPGLGKTSLAHLVASEMQTGIHVTSGPALERKGALHLVWIERAYLRSPTSLRDLWAEPAGDPAD